MVKRYLVLKTRHLESAFEREHGSMQKFKEYASELRGISFCRALFTYVRSNAFDSITRIDGELSVVRNLLVILRLEDESAWRKHCQEELKAMEGHVLTIEGGIKRVYEEYDDLQEMKKERWIFQDMMREIDEVTKTDQS